jgi:formyltetrahydrofolate deformylase
VIAKTEVFVSNEIFRLVLSCPDRPGIVARVSSLLFEHGGNILEARQFEDAETGKFFMRVVFQCLGETDALRRDLGHAASDFDMEFRLCNVADRKRVLILVSTEDHCLSDLLYRHRIGELKMDIAGVISNHPKDARNLTTISDIPYHYFPVTNDTKPRQEQRIKSIIDETGADLIILARYMQILSDDLCTYLAGRCLNIHHSFLPGFKGARPYHQAHARGVKMIGATAHFVTADLDEGPIIAQDVEQVSHADTPEDLIRKGRDIERRVLARAVTYLLDDRVMLNENKTVVFSN